MGPTEEASRVATSPATFREQVRAVLAGRYPSRDAHARVQLLGAGDDDLDGGRELLALLAEQGWATPTWPPSVGGLEDPALAATLAAELARFAVPDLYPFAVGLALVGPVVAAFGTQDQQARWLDPIRRGAEIWCQLFSEPGAGSDLAGLAARAVARDGTWTITGQKVWSSRAAYSHWGLLLARTDPDVPKHAGITCFALPMRALGVQVRPLHQMNGDAHFSEVFLDDVVVDDALRIGGPGDGWRVATATLAYERAALGARTGGDIDPAQLLALVTRSRGLDPALRHRVVDAYLRLRLLELAERRAEALHEAHAPEAASAAAGAKLRKTATFKLVADVATQIRGTDAMVEQADAELDGWTTLFLTAPSLSIRGGTDEIQRNVVGERVLGLPAEPRPDKNGPFRELVHSSPRRARDDA